MYVVGSLRPRLLSRVVASYNLSAHDWETLASHKLTPLTSPTDIASNPIPDAAFKPASSTALKKYIVDKHNCLRTQVQPPASNMLELRCNDQLTTLAQTLADKCIGLIHDPVSNAVTNDVTPNTPGNGGGTGPVIDPSAPVGRPNAYDRCDLTFCKGKVDGYYDPQPCSRNYCQCSGSGTANRTYSSAAGMFFTKTPTPACKAPDATFCPTKTSLNPLPAQTA
ncbi:hypothetical protein RvY_16362 [Ramazzottius varieornatus]|uniref:SCP domain-containing protein n=1 Tax=Ramazzottius varieornatus TaxID=947166 RepID=A0A1D1W110_RAMVA|nr:hypothetical protein RvY_16362 [Ramazzottius varieornatus]